MRAQRSLLNFAVLIAVATGTAVFVLNKAEEAIAEIHALANIPITLPQKFSHQDEFLDLEKVYTISLDTATWNTYRSEEYGLGFKYPPELGHYVVEQTLISEEELRELADEIDFIDGPEDIRRIARKSFDISFDAESPELGSVSFRVQEYSQNTPLEFGCQEGYCWASSILKDGEQIERNSNITIGGKRGALQDGYVVYGPSVERMYTVVLPRFKLEVSASHELFGGLRVNRSKYDGQTRFLEDIVEGSPEGPERSNFALLLQIVDLVVQTIEFK